VDAGPVLRSAAAPPEKAPLDLLAGGTPDGRDVAPPRVRAFTGRPALTPPLFESAIHTTRSLAQAGLGWAGWSGRKGNHATVLPY
jgi:hypothetical protein